MNIITSILCSFLVFFFLSCNEDNPTQINLNSAKKTIYSVDNNGENNKVVSEQSILLLDFDCISDSLIFFTTGHSIILQSTINPLDNYKFDIPNSNFLEGINFYNQGLTIVLGAGQDIYKAENYGGTFINLTKDTLENYPIYLEEANSIIYRRDGGENDYRYLEKLDLSTRQKTTLYKSKSYELFPRYVTQDAEKLIFYESRLNGYQKGYFKILEISNPENVSVLGSCSFLGAYYSSFSDDKIVHTLDGEVILIELSTATEKVLDYNINFANISNDGETIVYADDKFVYLKNLNDGTRKTIINLYGSDKYIHQVSLSPNSGKIIYVESIVPIHE